MSTTTPYLGLFGYDPSADADEIFDVKKSLNDNWDKIDASIAKLFPAMPTGTISWLASETIPDGFLKCDGSSVAKADYPELYAVIGDTFGAGTDTTFQLPDLRAKFIRGAGSSGNYSAVFGQTQDGSSLVVNSNAIMPSVKKPDYALSYSGGCTYGGSASGQTAYEYGLRPYNIALTPIIKYCGG